MRKPPIKVYSIQGKPEPEIVEDEDLEVVAELQAEAWRADKKAQKATEILRARILAGARIESSRFYWDAELGMVRSRKERTG